MTVTVTPSELAPALMAKWVARSAERLHKYHATGASDDVINRERLKLSALVGELINETRPEHSDI